MRQTTKTTSLSEGKKLLAKFTLEVEEERHKKSSIAQDNVVKDR